MTRELLAEQLTCFGPTFHKKLHKGLPVESISKQQMYLLFIVYDESGKTMKYYGDKMLVSKSSITILVDKLIEEKYVKRADNTQDRRESLLLITSKGKKFIDKQKEIFKETIVKKLSILDDEEIKRLLDATTTMIELLNKIE